MILQTWPWQGVARTIGNVHERFVFFLHALQVTSRTFSLLFLCFVFFFVLYFFEIYTWLEIGESDETAFEDQRRLPNTSDTHDTTATGNDSCRFETHVARRGGV